jgi:hypothetical protein
MYLSYKRSRKTVIGKLVDVRCSIADTYITSGFCKMMDQRGKTGKVVRIRRKGEPLDT